MIQYDINKYCADIDDANYSVQRYKLNTIQKEVLAKYDDKFINKIKKMENEK